MGLPIGSVTVATPGTRVRVVESGNQVSAVTFRALGRNKGPVYVGDYSVSATNGYTLEPGDELHIKLRETGQLSSYYVDADIAGDMINFVGISS